VKFARVNIQINIYGVYVSHTILFYLFVSDAKIMLTYPYEIKYIRQYLNYCFKCYFNTQITTTFYRISTFVFVYLSICIYQVEQVDKNKGRCLKKIICKLKPVANFSNIYIFFFLWNRRITCGTIIINFLVGPSWSYGRW
jgi:hypothetical protein